MIKYGYLLSAVIVISGAFLFASSWEKSRRPPGFDDETLAALAAEAQAKKPAETPAAPTPSTAKADELPIAVVDNRRLDFGIMSIGAELQHDFVIRNAGRSPLRLTKGKTTCKCTIANLAETEILPGQSAPVRLSWHAIQRNDNFQQTATIHTNDPQNSNLDFVVQGRVEPRVIVEPGWRWPAGDISGDQVVSLTGVIYSFVEDDFKVVGFKAKPSANKTMVSPMHRIEKERLREEPSAKFLAGRLHAAPAKTKATPLSPERLKALGAKSGYELSVEFAPSPELGLFREDLEIRTNLEGDEVLSCMVVGRRVGPYTLLAPENVVEWSDVDNTLNIGRFSAAEGKSVRLSVVLLDLPGAALEMTASECQPAVMQCQLTADPQSPSSRHNRYFLTIDIPAGQPPMTFDRTKPALVHVSTNNPKLPQIELRALLTSF